MFSQGGDPHGIGKFYPGNFSITFRTYQIRFSSKKVSFGPGYVHPGPDPLSEKFLRLTENLFTSLDVFSDGLDLFFKRKNEIESNPDT